MMADIAHKGPPNSRATPLFESLTIPNLLAINFHETERVGDHHNPNLQPLTPRENIVRCRKLYLALNRSKEYDYSLPLAAGSAFAIENLSDGSYPFKVKVTVGGVNAASPTREGQDYFVIPKQRWIDGWAIAPGRVRQFVVTDATQKLSVEDIAPVNIPVDPDKGIVIEVSPPFGPVRYDDERKPYHVPYPAKPLGETGFQVSVIITWRPGREEYKWRLPSDYTAWDLKRLMLDKLNMAPHRHYLTHEDGRHGNRSLPDTEALAARGVTEGSVIYSKLRAGGGAPHSGDLVGKIFERVLALSSGGRIEQMLEPDPDPSRWDTVPHGRFRIQIKDPSAIEGLSSRPDLAREARTDKWQQQPQEHATGCRSSGPTMLDPRPEGGVLPSALQYAQYGQDIYGLFGESTTGRTGDGRSSSTKPDDPAARRRSPSPSRKRRWRLRE
ncbi:hypothetical protein VTK73DRAFT_4563 [Phialemonium thermophilum]|uniref:Ubiquitin-like domain-containing protein n=1 Tax=Phialemonium thermophilum TaxID=223376 RepID=A0ABR3WSU7_9PEZI